MKKKKNYLLTILALIIICGAEHNSNEVANYKSEHHNTPLSKFKNTTLHNKLDYPSRDFDLPQSIASLNGVETFGAGIIIIPMDNTLQGTGSDFNLKAYGLLVHLLHAGIPLKWAINPTKSKNGIDFTASAKRVAPSSSTSSSRNFKAGPFIVYPGYEVQAMSVINSYGNNVNVYELTQTASINIHSDITHKPKAALLDNGGNADIHEDIYEEAGLVSNTHYVMVSSAAQLNGNSCFTFASEPHTKPSDISTSIVNQVELFLQSGGNFLAQCEGVEAYANSSNGSLLATYSSKPDIGGSIAYDNHSDPYAQTEGNLYDEGGSVESFIFTSNPSGGKRIAYDTNNGNNYKAYVGQISGVTASAGGYVHYLAGHEYEDSDISQTNGKRMLLNAMMRSADRPGNCNLSIITDEICDDGQDNDGDGLIDCADPDCLPVITTVLPTQLTCPIGVDNGEIVITATGQGTLEYSITNEPNYQASNTFSNLGPGLYTIRVKSSTGCVATYDASAIQLNTASCPEICDDGQDNDGDGLVDCDDPDCGSIGTANQINNN